MCNHIRKIPFTPKSIGASTGESNMIGHNNQAGICWLQQEPVSRIAAISRNLYGSHRIIISLCFYKSLVLPSAEVNEAPVNISGLAHRNSILRESTSISIIETCKKQPVNASFSPTPITRWSLPYRHAATTAAKKFLTASPQKKHQVNTFCRSTFISVSLLLKHKPSSQSSANCQEKSTVIWHNAKCVM